MRKNLGIREKSHNEGSRMDNIKGREFKRLRSNRIMLIFPLDKNLGFDVFFIEPSGDCTRLATRITTASKRGYKAHNSCDG